MKRSTRRSSKPDLFDKSNRGPQPTRLYELHTEPDTWRKKGTNQLFTLTRPNGRLELTPI